ncbi:cellular response to endothelin [Branchiostoma belcheri]|nr:cellular response to endothelin [Branchiostoma belcheri]
MTSHFLRRRRFTLDGGKSSSDPPLKDRTIGSEVNVLAKALYDNIPETPDELGFRKGDIVTVLEQNTQGLEGWWLCSLHGRQGIAPGNRMKLLAGMYDKPFSPTPQQQPQQPLYQTPAKAAGYQVPPSHQYQSPPSHQPLYKVPSSGGSYSTPSPFSPYSTPSPHAVYNVPTSHGGFASTYQVPPSSAGYQVPPAAPGYGYPGQQTSPGYQVLPGAVREQNYQVPPSLQRQRNSATNISTNKQELSVPPDSVVPDCLSYSLPQVPSLSPLFTTIWAPQKWEFFSGQY